MSGAPTEAEIQAQWRAGIDIIETLRNHFDGTIAGAGGKLDTLTQILEGEYLPAEYTRLMGQVRAQASDMVSPAYASQVITPALFEYGKILAADATYGLGAGYRAPGDIFASLYDWFHDKSLSVTSRGITFDTTPTAGGSNVGNGTISRLTIDENAYNIESCTIEKKQFVCRADQNSGTEEHAETFEMIGEPSSFDSLLRGSFGSGDAARTVITSKHAGTGSGGSLLQNSSFSQYAAGSSPKFTGWTETAGGNHISQDATNFYRSHPNATTNASLKMTGSHGTLTVTQPLSAMRVRRLDPNTPYFLRVMVNKTIGSAVGGSVTLTMGGVSKTVTISALASGWAEITIDLNEDCWFKSFNQDAFSVAISWTSSTSGYLLVDDVIFSPWDLIDGTYWCIRQNAASPTSWLQDDILTLTDTGGAPGTGKIQYWLWVAGFGYLPTSGSPTFTDP
jgi:hypothetical protein